MKEEKKIINKAKTRQEYFFPKEKLVNYDNWNSNNVENKVLDMEGYVELIQKSHE